jgi:hypothetical protein
MMAESDVGSREPNSQPQPKKSKILSSKFQKYADSSDEGEEDGGLDEFDAYLTDKRVNIGKVKVALLNYTLNVHCACQRAYRCCAYTVESDDGLRQFWKDVDKYPRLKRLASTALAIPASSAASERVFSTSGNILVNRRSSLKPSTAEKLGMLHSNIP